MKKLYLMSGSCNLVFSGQATPLRYLAGEGVSISGYGNILTDAQTRLAERSSFIHTLVSRIEAKKDDGASKDTRINPSIYSYITAEYYDKDSFFEEYIDLDYIKLLFPKKGGVYGWGGKFLGSNLAHKNLLGSFSAKIQMAPAREDALVGSGNFRVQPNRASLQFRNTALRMRGHGYLWFPWDGPTIHGRGLLANNMTIRPGAIALTMGAHRGLLPGQNNTITITLDGLLAPSMKADPDATGLAITSLGLKSGIDGLAISGNGELS